MYEHPSPAQSTTSLSDNDDDDLNKSSFFNTEPVPTGPARWSARHSLIFSPGLSPVQPTSSPISNLPTELLIHVLRHLHSTRDLYHSMLVNRSWCECSVELLWHRPSFTTTNALVKMMRIIGSEDPAFTYARFIRRLNFLYLGPDLTDALFSRVAQCARLERLTLVNCKSISDNVLVRVLPWFPNLVAIDLTGVVETNDKSIIALAGSSKRLQGINLGGCRRVSDKGILALAGNCALLRRVKLSGVDHLTDIAVSALARACPLLLEIDLNNCKRVSDKSVRDVWTNSVHMREMRLSHVEELTDNGFPAPPRALSPSASPQPPATNVNPFPASMAKLVEEIPPLIMPRRFEHLRMLNLTACSGLTDDAVDGIVTNAPKIRNLVLARCSQITDHAVESICKLGKHLHYLHLGHCSSITDAGVKNLARACTRLRYIDFANCTLLTDMSVFELSSLPKLRRIGLVRVSNLTDEAIYSLADRHATLERIHLSYCNGITVMSIHFLLQKLPKLTHLSLTGIPAFRRPELQKFCRSPPPEFNSQQRAAFCVYSGKGVSELREFLIELFNNITDEPQNTDDTDYDDQDDYDEDYPPADGEADVDADVDAEGDADDDDTMDAQTPPEQPIASTSAAEYASNIRGHSMARAQRHQPTLRTTLAAAAGPAPAFYPHPDHRVHLASMPVAAPWNASHWAEGRRQGVDSASGSGSGSVSGAYPAQVAPGVFLRRRQPDVPGFATQPFIEASTSPAPSETSSNNTAAAFYRTYPEERSPTASVRNGALTPDLVFAEIGHGRGTGLAAARGYAMSMPMAMEGVAGPSYVPPPLASPTEAVYSATAPGHAVWQTQADEQAGRASASGSRSAWTHVHREAVSPTEASASASARELHDSVQSALGAQQQHQTPHPHQHQHALQRAAPSAEARGRNVTRGWRNATQFLFSRGSSHGSHTESSNGGGSGR